MNKITIGNKEYKAKWSLRALFVYEELTGEVYDASKTLNILIMFYCILMVSNDDFMEWNEFLEVADKDKDISTKIKQWFEGCADCQNRGTHTQSKKKRILYRLKKYIKLW